MNFVWLFWEQHDACDQVGQILLFYGFGGRINTGNGRLRGGNGVWMGLWVLRELYAGEAEDTSALVGICS